jgi:hypothetical protein
MKKILKKTIFATVIAILISIAAIQIVNAQSPFDDDPADPTPGGLPQQDSPFDDDPADPTPGGLPPAQESDLTCEEKYVQERIFTCLDLGEDCLAQVEETYKNTVENCNQQYEDEKQQCENKVRNESERCDAFEPGTPKREECESYLNLEEIRNECLSQALAKWNSCNAVAEVEKVEGNEKCEKEEEDAYQVCVEKLRSEAEEECKEEEDKDEEEEEEDEEKEEDKITSGQFDVSKFLKIEEGQTYLEEENVEKYGVVFFIVKAIEVLTKIISSFALLFVIVGGIILMVSSGNEDLQRRGKEIIKYALIGLVIAFASLLIVTFVQSLFFTI